MKKGIKCDCAYKSDTEILKMWQLFPLCVAPATTKKESNERRRLLLRSQKKAKMKKVVDLARALFYGLPLKGNFFSVILNSLSVSTTKFCK